MFNLKYKKRFDKRSNKIISLENLNFPQDLIYVSNFTPLGYLMKEEAYAYWLLKNNTDLKEEIKNSFDFNFIKKHKRYFSEETKWMTK